MPPAEATSPSPCRIAHDLSGGGLTDEPAAGMGYLFGRLPRRSQVRILPSLSPYARPMFARVLRGWTRVNA
jgi:hypothetical protein